MAASAGQGVIDPTKPAKYPVVLSDALLGKATKEVFTGVRYNHKPSLSSDTAPNTARIKASAANEGTYNLSFNDNGDKYAYNGVRTTDDNQYVLIFDPARQVFVLHRLDSVFNMNLIRTPTNNDAESLREKHPQLDTIAKPPQDAKRAKNGGAVGGKPTPSAKEGTTRSGKDERSRKPEKEKAPAPAPLPLPMPKPEAAKPASAPPRRRQASPEESEEDDDDDGGLTIEYPGGGPPTTYHRTADFSPAFPAQIRRFSDFVRSAADEEDEDDADADAEFEEDNAEEEDDNNLDNFKLPSPVNHHKSADSNTAQNDLDADADDLEDDLEAELENALQQASAELDSESSVSEED